ncbi:Hsp20/alpha crystallin family protein [Methylomarinum vadi]|uniref:Hsp20/alpha crystallin family protein n=1 Tax=Methylomarinum vadi TaxID=438855 RepID=UPI0004DF850D|nr:Hsp20/alpha crystallin family protein [Methylomarinum vadi]
MNKSLVMIAGLILFAIIGWQAYMIYTLHHQVQRLSEPAGIDDESFFNQLPQDDFFGNKTWDPYQEFQRLQQNIDRTFGNAFSRFHLHRGFSSLTKMPALDLKEEADRYIVKMDIPGADTSSLSVDLDGEQLSITVKTEQQDESKPGQGRQHFQRRERFAGTFHRSLTLPGPVNASAMKSDYKNGVLTIIIPKA